MRSLRKKTITYSECNVLKIGDSWQYTTNNNEDITVKFTGHIGGQYNFSNSDITPPVNLQLNLDQASSVIWSWVTGNAYEELYMKPLRRETE